MKTTIYFLLLINILISIPKGESLDCHVCESSSNSTCRDYDTDLPTNLCSLGENVCLAFGIKNKYNEDRPFTYVRRCAMDDTICNKVNSIYGDAVIQCTTCFLETCNKDTIQ